MSGGIRFDECYDMKKQILHKTIAVAGVNIFYREAGDRSNPSILLLHGFPSSSAMFKNLMTALADRYHLVAPDYPGFGFSGFPDKEKFEYTFKNIAAVIDKFTDAIGLTSFTIYLHDYGAPMGLRVCVRSPEKIEKIIVQNGNAYDEGMGPQWDEIKDFWKHPTEEKKKKLFTFMTEEGTKDQYYSGLPEHLHNTVSPELWRLDWQRMLRPGNLEMQFELNCDYQTNPEMFPAFHEFFRKYQPPALVIWGKYDPYFNVEEAECYKRDLKNVQVHILEGSHMALESNFDEVLELIEEFMES